MMSLTPADDSSRSSARCGVPPEGELGPSSIAGDEDGRYAEEMEEVVGRWGGAPRASAMLGTKRK